MARAIRTNVTISLGFFSFNVKLTSATEKVPGPVTMCAGHGDTEHPLTKVRQRLACPGCDNDDAASFVRAMEVGGDQFLQLPGEFSPWAEDELSALKNIKLDVHDAAEVENRTLPGEKFYYLEPQSPVFNKAYGLMVNRVLTRTDKAFVFEYAVRGVPAFYRLKVMNDALCAVELARPELIREAPQVELDYNSAEITMADAAIDALNAPFLPEVHADKRKAALDAYVAAHTDAAVTAVTPDQPVAPVLDMMGALQASIDAAKPAQVPAPRKRAAKKAAPRAKKAAPAKAARTRKAG